MYKLTQEEADILIKMIKKYVTEKLEDKMLELPGMKQSIDIEVVGESRENKFIVNINDKRINEHAKKFTCQGRLKSNDAILMRLDIGGPPHMNPGGEKICGNHLHIYKEGFDSRFAALIDVEDDNLFDICYLFFEKFNIIDPPQFQQRIE